MAKYLLPAVVGCVVGLSAVLIGCDVPLVDDNSTVAPAAPTLAPTQEPTTIMAAAAPTLAPTQNPTRAQTGASPRLARMGQILSKIIEQLSQVAPEDAKQLIEQVSQALKSGAAFDEAKKLLPDNANQIIEQVSQVLKSGATPDEVKNMIQDNLKPILDQLSQMSPEDVKPLIEEAFQQLKDMAPDNLKPIIERVSQASTEDIQQLIQQASQMFGEVNKTMHDNVKQIIEQASQALESGETLDQVKKMIAENLPSHIVAGLSQVSPEDIKQLVEQANNMTNDNVKQLVEQASKTLAEVNVSQIIDQVSQELESSEALNQVKDMVLEIFKQLPDIQQLAEQSFGKLDEASDNVKQIFERASQDPGAALDQLKNMVQKMMPEVVESSQIVPVGWS